MPADIRDKHDKWVHSYLEEERHSDYLLKERSSIGFHKASVIFPLTKLVKVLGTKRSSSIEFAAIFTINKQYNYGGIMLVSPFGRIYGFSAGIPPILGTTHDKFAFVTKVNNIVGVYLTKDPWSR